MIEINGLKFSYNGQPAIDGLSLYIRSASWLGIIGPNGAGKTTLIKLISGFLAPKMSDREHGAYPITVAGQPITAYSRREMARLIAVVPQIAPATFSFSALEVVLMGRYPYLKRFGFETQRDVETAREVMQRTDTWQFRNRLIDQLSGGERQRVFIARALAQRPQILLLDEPTTFLDIKHQIRIMEIIDELNKIEGLTIVSAIHDINLTISYCHEIALLNNGQVYKHGSAAQVITYANLKDIFGADVYVGINEITGKPYYVPMGKRQENGKGDGATMLEPIS